MKMNVYKTLFLKILSMFCFFYSIAGIKLATVPNVDVLLNEELFMEVLKPEEVSYTFRLRLAKNFGMPFTKKFRSIEMMVGEPYHGCSALRNAQYVQDKVLLVQRGECSFVTKALNAERAGAVAVVITDNEISNDQMYIDMIDDNTDRTVEIPATFLLGRDGDMIKRVLDSLGLDFAIVNIPVNVTGTKVHLINQPPWDQW